MGRNMKMKQEIVVLNGEKYKNEERNRKMKMKQAIVVLHGEKYQQ